MYYTSYYGNMNKIDRTKYVLASISFQKPDFCDKNVLDCSFLGPWKDLLDGYKNGTISEKEYADQYLDNLKRLWPGLSNWFLINAPKDIVFLCYEKPSEFCHRHLLAQFLKEQGFECKELQLD